MNLMRCKWRLGSKWMIGVLLLLALPVSAETARLVKVVQSAKRRKPRAVTKSAPVVSRAQMGLAQQMVRNAYTLGQGL